jgi:hypothetical protein
LETSVNQPTLHRGRIAKDPKVLSVRLLTKEDMACLKENKRIQPPRVRALRDTHHRLARLVAAGLRNEEVLRISGFSQARLMVLKNDPAFIQLVTEYRGKVTEAYIQSLDELTETSVSNMMRMERMVEDHLDAADESGDLIPLKTLFTGIGDRMDRFGYSKKTVNTNVNIDFAKHLERAMAAKGQATVIDSRAVRVAPASAPALESIPQESPTPARYESPEGTKSAAGPAGFRRRV